MSYKNVTLISFWIFSASYMVPVLGMHNNNQSRSATIVEEALKLPQKARRKVLKNQQPHENSITNVAATVKALSSSLEKIRVRKTKKPLQQEQNLQQQKQPKERQKQLKRQQSPQQKQTAQPQQQQQKTPQQQQNKKNAQFQPQYQQQKENAQPQQQQQKTLKQRPQQKTNIKRTHDVNNIIQGEQSKQPRRWSPNSDHKKNQTVYNAATILAVASNAVHAEHVQMPLQQNKKNTIQAPQKAAVVGQNQHGKKVQQQLGGNKSQNTRSGQQKAQNTVPVQSQKDQPEIIRSKDSVHIYDPADKSEVIVFKDCKDILSPGVYYRSEDGLMPVPKDLRSNNGKRMVKNHLSQLTPLNDFVCQKTDLRHRFSQCVEKECGDYARVVIRNAKNDPQQMINSAKKFHMYATVRGQINKVEFDRITNERMVTEQLSGVFEFEIIKGLYEKKGQCMHRFLAPKGMVGAEGFGADARESACNKQITL